VRLWYNTRTGEETWMTKDKAPVGPDWLPKSKPTEKAGTEFERIRIEVINLINGGNEEQAVNTLVFYLLGKDSMMRFMPDEAQLVAEEMIKRIGFGAVETDERSVAKELGVGKDKIDLGEI
jgi:hypothetical protein